MSTAAVMLVRDEQDIVEATLRHLVTQVDEVIVADNLSTDATPEIINALIREGLPCVLRVDGEPGYYQSVKTTNLAAEALARGHTWVVPCDADEVWYSPHGRIGDVLEALEPQWMFASAALYDHKPTSFDPEVGSPFERIGWRFREPGALPKVAARLVPGLRIGMGNHEASAPGAVSSRGGPPPTRTDLLVVRHFSWRSAAQFLHKRRIGAAAYAATDLPATYGEHWRSSVHMTDDAILDQFREWFFEDEPPGVDGELIYDPAPVGPWTPPADA